MGGLGRRRMEIVGGVGLGKRRGGLGWGRGLR